MTTAWQTKFLVDFALLHFQRLIEMWVKWIYIDIQIVQDTPNLAKISFLYFELLKLTMCSGAMCGAMCSGAMHKLQYVAQCAVQCKEGNVQHNV